MEHFNKRTKSAYHSIMIYKYLGDKFTDIRFKGQLCTAPKRENGKCFRGKNGNFLVRFMTGEKVVVIGRLLRKTL